MTTVRVKSTIFKEGKFKFDSFEINFNKLGIAEVELKNDVEVELFSKTVESYPQICYLEDSANEELEGEKQKNIAYLHKIIGTKEEEIKGLKLANEELATTNIQLKTELKYLRVSKNQVPAPVEEVNVVTGQENASANLDVVDKSKKVVQEEKIVQEEIVLTEDQKQELNEQAAQNSQILAELNKKTIPELIEVLKDTFKDFESEWKIITKKDKIVAYILNKTLALEEK